MVLRIICVMLCSMYGSLVVLDIYLGWYGWATMNVICVLMVTVFSFLFKRERIINELTRGSRELKE